MEKQFVKSEIAKKLKEKGFNEPTMAYYNEKDEFVFTPYNNEDINLPNKVTKTENENNYSSAPLWQQAIDWFYDNHEILIVQIPSYSMKVWEVSKKGNKDVISGLSINKAIEEAIKLI